MNGQCYVLYDLAILYEELGDKKMALNSAKESYRLAKENNFKNMIANNKLIFSNLNIKDNNYEKAQKYLKEAIIIYNQLNNIENKIYAQCLLADAYLGNKETQKALNTCIETDTLLQKINNTSISRTSAELYKIYAKTYFKLKKKDKAIFNAQKALNFYIQKNNYKEASELSKLLYNNYVESNENENIIKYGTIYLDQDKKFKTANTKSLFYKNEIKLEKQKIEYREKSEKKENTLNFIYLTFFILMFISLIIIPYFYLKNKKIKESFVELSRSKIIKTKFLTKIAHELNTPLNIIVGYSELISKSDISNQNLELNQSISEQSYKLLFLTQSILSVNTNLNTKNKEILKPYNLKELATNVYKDVKENNKNKRINIDLDNSIDTYFYMDADNLKAIILNLLTKLIEFSKYEKIKLAVKTENNRNRNYNIKFSFIEYNKKAGFSAEIINFFKINTSESSILKLNLMYINSKLLELNSELVYSKNEMNLSEINFTINLEKVKAEVQQKIAKTQDKTEVNSVKSILIVDDNDLNMVLIKKMLTNLYKNIKITEAKNGKLAIDSFLKSKPDLILMDLQMPVMNGFEAANIIRSYSENIPIIAVSASFFSENEEFYNEAKMTKYIEKPLNTLLLKSYLDEFINP